MTILAVLIVILSFAFILLYSDWDLKKRSIKELKKEVECKTSHIFELNRLKDRLSDDLSSCINERNVLNEEVKNLKQLDKFHIKEPRPIILTNSLPVFRARREFTLEQIERGAVDYKKVFISEILEKNLAPELYNLVKFKHVEGAFRKEYILDFEYTFNFIRNNNV